uniref:G-protein coupled receptors family 1 profile domain-containing protein n=1 Tax=Mastacembelus armatus TaxID=205130 RepID=A0A3Q3LJV4_9TELE
MFTSFNCSLRLGNLVDTLQGLAYSPVFILGFLVNAAALRAIISKRDSRTDTGIYMFNLAISDFTLVLFLPFRINDSFLCLPKTKLCTFLIYMHFINMYASILTTIAISVQRYLVIRGGCCSLTIWVLLGTLCALFQENNCPDKLWKCYERCKNLPLQQQLIVILIVFGFLVPLLIIVFCTSQVICILSKVDEGSEEKKRIVGIVTANMIVFIVCYTPIHVGLLVNYFYKPPPNWIAATNCCFDSIGYYFLLKQFYL